MRDDDELIVDNLPTETTWDKQINDWAERAGPCSCGPDCEPCWRRNGPCEC